MPIKIYVSYAREDEPLLNRLKIHLKPLQREGLIDMWYDRDISAGTEWAQEISTQLNNADIILLLISPDFMNSDYCYSVELARAYELHSNGEARLIPIIFRPAYWQGLLGKFQVLPRDGRPVKSRYWHTMDEAFSDITDGIRKTINTISISRTLNENIRNLNETPAFNQISKRNTMTPEEGEQFRKLLVALSQESTYIKSSPPPPIKAVPQRQSLEPSLYIAMGQSAGQVYDIRNSLSIGRRLDNEIFLQDPLVSRHHANVYIDANGICILKDVGSANGTIVNGNILKKDEIHILDDKDEIEVGDTLLIFRKGQEPK